MLEPVAELGHTRDARTKGTFTPGNANPPRSPCAIAPDPFRLEWTGAPGRALRTRAGDASNVEAALGTSHCLTGTLPPADDPAILNGRRRGTKDFLGRGEQSSQSAKPRSKAQRINPVDVFGAASAATAMVDNPSVRTESSGLPFLPKHNVRRCNYSSGFRSALT